MRRPDFLIPGAQKCGTTTLYYLLRQHPQCYMPEEKEPQAFALSSFSETNYATLFSPAEKEGQAVAGEASTSYFLLPGVPERIKNVCGNSVLFIVILRDPVERTLSSYLHMYKRGDERRDWNQLFSQLGEDKDAALAAEVIAAEIAEKRGTLNSTPYREQFGEQRLWNFLYLQGSNYTSHLQRFFSNFNPDSFHVLFLEDFIRDPQGEMSEIFEFLGIDATFIPEGLTTIFNRTEVESATGSQKSGLLVKFRDEQRMVPRLQEAVRSELEAFFLPEKQRVAELLGNIPPEWR